MLKLIYSFLFSLFLPILLLHLLWRCYKNPEYAKQWQHRFGFINSSIKPHGILIHAVSLGENVAASALVKQLLKDYPHYPLYCSTHTLTGAQKIQSFYGQQVKQLYLPYDLHWAMQKFFKTLKPKIVILVESEIWPNLVTLCAKKHIPLFLINARLSPKSFAWHQRFNFFFQPLLQKFTHIVAQSKIDVASFHNLGVAAEKITLAGNLKFIINYPQQLLEKAYFFSKLFQKDYPLWIAASTHLEDELIILKAQHIIQGKLPTAKLLIVPRHPERFNEVETSFKKSGFTVLRRSTAELQTKKNINFNVILGDSLGELLVFYKIADVALVGGSFTSIGGHSLIEPAAMHVPILTGPHHFNSKEIADELIQRQALIIVNDANSLADTVIDLLSKPSAREAMAIAAEKFVAENQNCLDKVLAILKPYL